MSITFKGGIHPPQNKVFTKDKPILALPAPEEIIIPLSQHIGAPSKPIVEKGDRVTMGQRLSESEGFVSVPVHSSVSGKVKDIKPWPHFSGESVLSVIIENDGKDTPCREMPAHEDWENLSPDQIRGISREAGLAGMGGAAFPTVVKLSPPPTKQIDTVILNGAECEPYLTADHRLMLEYPDEIIEGLRMIMKTLGVEKSFIGIEKNKPDAIKVFKNKTEKFDNISVIGIKVKYPQGAEKQLIDAITGRKVPAGGLPFDVGCLVQNVGTAKALYDAVVRGKPLYERVVTVTGKTLNNPQNLMVRIGTPVRHLIDACDGTKDPIGKIIMGGPMMGIALYADEVPIVKGTSGILVFSVTEADLPREKPCISCARCVDVCPMKLLPNRIATLIENERFQETEEYGIFDCMECGSCTYVCPTKRRLLHYIKWGKDEIIKRRNKEK
ncbi:electron transport complex subunit RsxC [bacterium]|nr:electron transport complex subunit RsxC [bacterium]